MYTSYIWHFCRFKAARLKALSTTLKKDPNAQDLTELSNRLIVESLQRHADQVPRLRSSISFFYLTSSVSWYDQHFKLTRDGKRALSQPAATRRKKVNWICILVLKTFSSSSSFIISSSSSNSVMHSSFSILCEISWLGQHKPLCLAAKALLLCGDVLMKLLWLCLSKRRSVWLLVQLAEQSEPWIHSGDANRQSVRELRAHCLSGEERLMSLSMKAQRWQAVTAGM